MNKQGSQLHQEAVGPTVDRRRQRRLSGSLLICLGLLALLIQAGLFCAQWWRNRLPDVRVGQPAESTLISPRTITVVDVASTSRLRQRAAARVVPVFRFDASLSEVAAARFLEKYDAVQNRFIKGLQKRTPLPLSSGYLEGDEYRQFLMTFKLANSDFPLSAETARVWATQFPEDPVRRESVRWLRNQQSQYLTSGAQLPGDIRHHATVWLTAPADNGGPTRPMELEQMAHPFNRKSFRTVEEVTTEPVNFETVTNGEWAAYLAGFLQPNVQYDAAFTQLCRDEATASLIVHTEFAAGTPLLSAQVPVTETQRAGLMKLREILAGEAALDRRAQWWLPGLGFLCLAGGLILRVSGRPDRSTALSVMETSGPMRPSEKQFLREGLVRQMAGWLKEQFIGRLLHQRNEAVAHQAATMSKVEEINARLDQLSPDIRQRIASYEARIKTLEQELLDANEVNKELIRTRISMARKELEIEKAKSNLVWN